MLDINTFEDINFHDCKVYSMGFDSENNQFLIDIDFIAKWITGENDEFYSFDITPSTLVFENVWDLNIDISMNSELIIDNIERFNPTTPKNIEYLPPFTMEYDWSVMLLQGEINFKSIGVKLYQRRKAKRKKGQSLEIDERGGFSLEKEGNLCQMD